MNLIKQIQKTNFYIYGFKYPFLKFLVVSLLLHFFVFSIGFLDIHFSAGRKRIKRDFVNVSLVSGSPKKISAHK